LITAGGNNSL